MNCDIGRKTFVDPIVVKAKGICPTELSEDQLPKMEAAIAHLAASIGQPAPCDQNKMYPDPLLEKMPNQFVGWGGTEQEQARIFANILSGTYLKQSDLDGITYFDIAKYLESWFQYFITHSPSKDASERIQSMIPQLQSLQLQQKELDKIIQNGASPEEVRKAADQWRKSVVDLSDGDSYLMIGGWTGLDRQAHTILYEFKRVGDTFEMRIFNTGSGIENTHLRMIEGIKNKTSPVLCKSAIPLSALTQGFFQSLLEPLLLPVLNLDGVQSDAESCKKMIYKMFFSLDGRLEGSSGFITTQIVGTCATSSLFSYIRYRIGQDRLGLYEQIQLWVRIGTLAQAWKSWKDVLQGTEIEKKSHLMSLLEKGSQKLISDSIKPNYLKGNSWFAHLEMEEARSLGSKVQLFLARTRAQMREKAQSDIERIRLPDQNIPPLRRDVLEKAFFQKPSSRTFPILFNSDIHPISDPSQCRAYLKTELRVISRECNSENASEIQAQLQWLVESLPIPTNKKDDFWQQVPVSDIPQCCEIFDTIIKMYCERLPTDPMAILPEEQNVFFALLTIIHTLGRREEQFRPVPEKVRLDRYRIGDPTKLLEDDRYTVFFSPSTKERRQKILNYFSEYNHRRLHARCLHDFSNSFADFPYNSDLPQDFVRELRKREEFRYYVDWILGDSNLVKQMDHVCHQDSIISRFDHKYHLSYAEKYAFRLMFDPCIALEKNGQKTLSTLYKISLISHVLSGNWDFEKSDDASNRTCGLLYKYEKLWVLRAFYQCIFKGKKYKFFQKQKKENFRSCLLHANKASLVKERKESEHALRPSLRAEGEVLPSIEVRNAEEPNAQPIHVLQTSLHAIASFKKREEQISFLIDFFRSYLSESSLITPVKDLCSQVEFLKICEEFVEKGINYYWNSPRKQDRDTSPTLFFIKVALLLRQWIPKELQSIPPVFTDQYIQSFLRQMIGDGTEENDAYLYLLLSHKNNEDPNENYIEDVLVSWFLMDPNFTQKETIDLHSGIDAKQMVWKQMESISQILEKSPELCQKVASLIWKGRGNESVLKWTYYPRKRAFYAYAPNRDEIVLDLQRRAVRINQSDFYTSKYLPNEVLSVPGFQRIFKDRRPSQFQCSDGKVFFFTDPVWGEVEVHLDHSENGTRIIRKDEKGNQYYFCSDLSPARKSIPVAIRKKSILWIPLELGNPLWSLSDQDTWDDPYSDLNRARKSIPVAIRRKSILWTNFVLDNLPWSLCDQDTGEVLYHLDHNLHLTLPTSRWKLIQTSTVFHKLDREGGVLTWMNLDQEKQIEYPFLKSRNGQKLIFDVTAAGDAYWRENPEYALAPEQQKGFLGTSHEYLLLQNKETGKRKILVPMHEMKKEQILSNFSFFKREFDFGDSDGNFKLNNIDRTPETIVFAFDLDNDEVIGQNAVENLYLMYLFITQRNYRLALHYFEKIEKSSCFTKNEWENLYTIIEWLQKLGDETPEASALLLKVCNLVTKDKKYLDIVVSKEWSLEKIRNIFSDYLESTNHRSSIFELTPAEEENWKQVFNTEARAGVHEDQSKQEIIYPKNHSSDSLGSIFPSFHSTVMSVPETVWIGSFQPPDRNKLPNLYFLSTLHPERLFPQYYHWIRTGTPELRENLAKIFSYHLFWNKNSEYLKILLMACHVKNAESLPELGDFDTYEKRKENFDHVLKEIRERTRLTHLKMESTDSPHLGTKTSAPLSHLKIGREEGGGILENKGIPLPTVSIPKVLLGPIYFEKQTDRYRLKEGADVLSLEQKIKEEERKVEEILCRLEDKILEAAYPESKDLNIRRKEQAAILAGHYSFSVTMPTLIGLFLEGTYNGFARSCPRSSFQEIDRLNLDLQTFLINNAYLQQLKRSRSLIKRNMDSETQNALGAELHAECSYPSTFRPGLVFEVVSNKRLRPLQSTYLQEIVKRMEGDHPFLLTHMIMGGGKTDVFASLLGRLWARKDQLALFLTPTSQLKTVQGNLTSSQWRCFKQGICTFDYQREDLSLQVLKDIHQELLDALENQRLVVLRSEMPQILELEFVSQLFESRQDVEKIGVLKKILNIFRKQTAVIVDEADQVFRTDRETNFPSGEKVSLDTQQISFISRIFGMIGVDLKDCSIQEKLGRLPLLIVEDPSFADIPQKFQESFLRYLNGVIDPKLESNLTSQEIDKQFLVFRDEIAKTDLKKAHLIALARHLIREILPHSLYKTHRRDFGRLREDTGKVVPYLAAGVPAKTEFGHPWELAAYHFQTALDNDISLALISPVIQTDVSVAKEQSLVWNCPIEKTPIFNEWVKHFGVSLLEIQDHPAKQVFLKKINADVRKKLLLEEKLIQNEVRYDPNYYSSNGHNLMMFPKMLAMTGTPYNRGSYPSKLGNKPILDLGSIEELKRTLIERNGEVHRVEDLSSAEKTLSQVLKTSKSAENLRALIDVGGCLLKKSNFEYAKEILTVFAKESTVQGVVFFQEGGKNLVFLKKGEEKPIDLIDTHLDTWKAQGIDPKQLFFFYDHLHSRGTDFPLPPKTVALALLKRDTQLHQILQGVARCRKLLTTQDVIYATEENDLDVEGIITRSEKLEKDLLRDQIYRHYIQEMDHVVRSVHLEELTIENSSDDLLPPMLPIERVIGYENSFKDRSKDPLLLRISHPISPYHEFGKIPSLTSAIKRIEEHGTTLLSSYASFDPSIKKQIHALIEDARKHLEDLPAFVEKQNQSLGREKHLQKQVQKEIKNEKLTELEKEWLKYQERPQGKVPKEAPWTIDQANALTNQKGKALDLRSCVSNGPLKTLLNDVWYQNPYSIVFDDNLYATTNWHQNSLPMFSKYHKPALQMLVVEHGEEGEKKLSGILLSLAESEFFRSTWCPKQEKDMRMWLIDADGHLLSSAKSALPDNGMMDRLLIQMNMLNGHTDWTTKNIEKAVSWIAEDRDKALVKIRLYYLQAMKEKEKAAILLAHPKLVSLQEEVALAPPSGSYLNKIGKRIKRTEQLMILIKNQMIKLKLDFKQLLREFYDQLAGAFR